MGAALRAFCRAFGWQLAALTPEPAGRGADTAAALRDPRLASAADFPDGVQPFLVKDLRRALRSPFFLVPFAALPVILAAASLWVMLQPEARATRAALSAAIYWAAVIPLFVFKPLHALFTIRGERAQGKLDLLLLSRLGASDLLVGKWLSVEAQSLLFLAAILPFFVLRVHLGQVELLDVGFALLVAMLWTSFIALFCLTISTFRKTAFGVWCVILVVGTPLIFLPSALLERALYPGYGSISFGLGSVLGLVLGVMVFGTIGFIAFAVATGNIDPPRVSREARRFNARALGLPTPALDAADANAPAPRTALPGPSLS